MRIVQCEKIFLSDKEVGTWADFDKILMGLERESENPDTVDSVQQIQRLLNDLWEGVEME